MKMKKNLFLGLYLLLHCLSNNGFAYIPQPQNAASNLTSIGSVQQIAAQGQIKMNCVCSIVPEEAGKEIGRQSAVAQQNTSINSWAADLIPWCDKQPSPGSEMHD